jgi:phenylalanyl-tRNA synthetase alpha chain
MNNPYTTYFTNLDSVNACLEMRDELNNSGEIRDLKQKIKTAPIEEKKLLGPKINELRNFIQKSCDNRIKEIQEEQLKDNFISFDPTFYSDKYFAVGNFHPISLVTQEIVKIFENLGFDVSDGPLVSDQDNNFTYLNMPSYHPARAMQDTFFLEQKDSKNQSFVLRTHTSAHQVPYSKNQKPPFRAVFPGRVYRNENIDATHDIMFHQIECVVVDKDISLSHLKTLIQDFYSKFFGQSDLQVRFRPSYFPYTIPSLEIDISNPFKNKAGSKIKDQDWIEVGGSGLIHSDVIKNYGLDPKEWQGLAFGFGIDRMAQLKLGISGMGQLFNGHLDFLQGRKFE